MSNVDPFEVQFNFCCHVRVQETRYRLVDLTPIENQKNVFKFSQTKGNYTNMY